MRKFCKSVPAPPGVRYGPGAANPRRTSAPTCELTRNTAAAMAAYSEYVRIVLNQPQDRNDKCGRTRNGMKIGPRRSVIVIASCAHTICARPTQYTTTMTASITIHSTRPKIPEKIADMSAAHMRNGFMMPGIAGVSMRLSYIP